MNDEEVEDLAYDLLKELRELIKTRIADLKPEDKDYVIDILGDEGIL